MQCKRVIIDKKLSKKTIRLVNLSDFWMHPAHPEIRPKNGTVVFFKSVCVMTIAFTIAYVSEIENPEMPVSLLQKVYNRAFRRCADCERAANRHSYERLARVC